MKKIDVKICVGTPCHLMGAEELLNMVKELPQKYQDKYKFSSSHCIESKCNMAPVVKVNDEVYGEMNPEKLRKILDKLM